jgi:hypothetical protein
VNYSLVESNRFGLRVFRSGVLKELSVSEIKQFLIDKQVDVYIFRLPVELQYQLHHLKELNMESIIADTLVYYTADLDKIPVKSLKNSDLLFEDCEARHFELLNQMVAHIFDGYKNHYFSNPHLDKNDILEGYKEWARSYVEGDGAGRHTYLVKKGEKYIGFATCGFSKEYSEGVLYGVLPEAQGGGIYGDIIRFTQNESKRKGFRQMKVSTQVLNYAVQKVWSREDFYMSNAYITVHINSFLGKKST